ncbi:MAG: DNA polymerase III subunit alpha [Alphaproteobacteria bacterium]|nr:DNA polymerase III subunit alpha [Alphaproteobacteria bacterium]
MSELQTFVHLRSYSSYSLLEGAIKLPDLISKISEDSMPAVAVTDKGNLFASLEFSMLASSKGIQPIIGCEFNFDPEIEGYANHTHGKNFVYDQILVIAKNDTGYQNLLKLSSDYYAGNESVITFSKLKECSDGLILLTGGQYGTFGKLLLQNQNKKAEDFLTKINEVFKDHLYIELMRHGLPEEEKIEKPSIDMAIKYNIPLVATNNVYFLNKEMHEAHQVLLCIADGKYFSDEERRRFSEESYLKTANEMRGLFSDIPEAIHNTISIAQRCSVKSDTHDTVFPEYKVSVGKDEKEELRILSREGLQKRLDFIDSLNPKSRTARDQFEKVYWDRFQYELSVIENMGFMGYFLIVSDFIRWSKNQEIPVGPGRGSGAGSVISWGLDITDVDPIKFGLLFERFLNPERVSLPDFDIDFCQARRDEVIKYVTEKYGKEKVAHIITFGKLQARAVVRDVGRVLSLPYGQIDMIAKMIPFNAINPVSLAQAIEMEPELNNARKDDQRVAKLIDISLKLEGLHRHASTHAAGVVISRSDLIETVPLYKNSKTNMPVIQYSMKYAEAAGLIKFDFLGLKTLTVIDKCQDLIRKNNSDFDLRKISFSDQKTFEMLSKGKSSGVFQFESSGMKDYLSKMKPDAIEDIMALGALYRPGPMDNIPRYIDCKHGKVAAQYMHPKLENVLKPTNGVVIYQEQVLEIAKVLAGYTLGAADLLRRAMGKKIKAEMDAQREMFVAGAIKNGITKDKATEIFDMVAKFAGYGFNKSHAVAYGVISYQTAYLKANYPVEMLVAIMNTEIDDTDKISMFCEDAKDLGISVSPPDINSSNAYFSVNESSYSIKFALGAIKNVSLNAMKLICEERSKNGVYKDIADFIKRLDSGVINKRQLEYLIKSGSFDSISSNRRQLFESIDSLIEFHNRSIEEKESNQINLFSSESASEDMLFNLRDTEDWDCDDRLNHECMAIGFYLSGHPLDVYKDYFDKINIFGASQIRNDLAPGRYTIKIAAIPVVIKTRSSPKGRYVVMTLSTPTGMVDATIFDDKIMEENRDVIYGKVPILVESEVRKDGQMERILALNVFRLDSYLQKQRQSICIEINSTDAMEGLKKLIYKSEKNSNTIIMIHVQVGDSKVKIELPKGYSCDVSKISTTNLPEGFTSLKHIV